MIEATEAERLKERLRDCLAAYDGWEMDASSGGVGRLRSVTQGLIEAAKACGWNGLVDPIDWARERVK